MAPAHLPPCPATPNCVSSDATDAPHAIDPFRLTVPPDEAWRVIRTVVAALPRTRIVEHTESRLHAECRSAVFRFVDDLELQVRPADGLVAVRSAARLGRWDLGVNRRRVEALRAALRRRRVIR
ncbi:MAG: DUF1499 domain-containing protein [Acidobacteriota bacterium]|nr:DUF1499 domain-containing protein [Acidobacteriota bacterium]